MKQNLEIRLKQKFVNKFEELKKMLYSISNKFREIKNFIL
jgi:phage regulator Rha-like protein